MTTDTETRRGYDPPEIPVDRVAMQQYRSRCDHKPWCPEHEKSQKTQMINTASVPGSSPMSLLVCHDGPSRENSRKNQRTTKAATKNRRRPWMPLVSLQGRLQCRNSPDCACNVVAPPEITYFFIDLSSGFAPLFLLLCGIPGLRDRSTGTLQVLGRTWTMMSAIIHELQRIART